MPLRFNSCKSTNRWTCQLNKIFWDFMLRCMYLCMRLLCIEFGLCSVHHINTNNGPKCCWVLICIRTYWIIITSHLNLIHCVLYKFCENVHLLSVVRVYVFTVLLQLSMSIFFCYSWYTWLLICNTSKTLTNLKHI